MTEEEKLKCLRYLSEVHRDQFNERRKYEWKAFLTLLIFYVLCVATKYAGETNLPDGQLFSTSVWVVFIGIAILTVLFLAKVNMVNNMNKGLAENAEDFIRDMLTGNSPELKVLFPTKAQKWISWTGTFTIHRKAIWSWSWQSVIVIIFAVTGAMLLTLT